MGRACCECLALCVAGEDYAALLNREELCARPELLSALFESLRRSDLWTRFWTLRVLLSLSSSSLLPSVRAALLAAVEGPRLLSDAVKDPREQVQLLAMQLLALLARDCLPLAQLAVYSGALEDLFAAVEQSGGVEGSAARPALAAAEALLEGSAANRAHFVGSSDNGAALCRLLEVDESDLLVLTDAKQSGLEAVCRLVLALRDAASSLPPDGGALLRERLALLALGRVPAAAARALALWALAAQRGAALDEQRAERAAEVLLRAAAPQEAAAAAALMATHLRARGTAAVQAPYTRRLVAHIIAGGGGGGGGGGSGSSCLLACHALCGLARAAGDALLAAEPELLASLVSTQSNVVGFLCALGRLRLLFSICVASRDAAATALRGGVLASLVEAVMSPSSSPHVAAAAGMVLRVLATMDKATNDVVVRRIGADKFFAAFRAVQRSKEWEDGADLSDEWMWNKDTVLVYPPEWRNAFRDELVAARSHFGPSSSSSGPPTPEDHQNQLLIAQLRQRAETAEKEAAALRAEREELRAQILQKQQVQSSPSPGMELDMLRSRDLQIASLKKELSELQQENERLLVLLADQEMALMK